MVDLADIMPGLTRDEIVHSGRRLRWLTAGHGAPPIVLVPGAGEIALDWLPVLPALASVSTVVALDRAGLGASDPDPQVSLDTQLADLAAVLSRTGPALLVGHSWGGLLAQLVAIGHPELIAGMVLVDPSHEDLLAVRPPLQTALQLRALVPLHRLGLFHRLARPMAQNLATLCTDDAGRRAAIEAAYLDAYSRSHQVAMIGAENRLSYTSVPAVRALREGARPLGVPLKVLVATTGKPPQMQRESARLLADLAARASRGQVVTVPDAGHYIHHDQPHAVVRAVRDVLDDLQ